MLLFRRPGEGFELTLDEAAGRRVMGYASAWNTRDSYGDKMQKGAFKKTLRERGEKNQIKVLYQHDLPIGLPEKMKEDDRGLYTESVISDTPTGNEALTLIKDGVIDQLSVGFDLIKGQWEATGDEYSGDFWDYFFRDPEWGDMLIQEAKLYEFSFVTFAANEDAVVTGMKELLSLKSFDSRLREMAEMLKEVKTMQRQTAVTQLEQTGTGTLLVPANTTLIVPTLEQTRNLDETLIELVKSLEPYVGEDRADRALASLKALQESHEPAPATQEPVVEPLSEEVSQRLKQAGDKLAAFAIKSFAPAES